MICGICNNVEKMLGYHLKRKHNLSFKEYYDRFLKKQKEDICNNKNCVEVTKFVCSAVGYEKAYYRKFCSKKCAGSSEITKQNRKLTNIIKYGVENAAQRKEVQIKMKQTMLKKYGVEYISQNTTFKEKIKKTNLKKYGVEHTSQLKEIQEKCKKTNLERYGIEYSFQNETTKSKIKKTNLEKYGFENPSFSKDIKDKISKSNKLCSKQALKKRQYTNLEKYGYKNILKSPDIKNKIKQICLNNFLNKMAKCLTNINLEIVDKFKSAKNDINLRCLKCNTEFISVWRNIYQRCGLCPNCYPSCKSVGETDISNFIKNLGFETTDNSKNTISPYELDIYIPYLKIAIEYNGLYWHSEAQGKDKNYHLNKLNLCLEKGINLIQIFEDEWLFKQNIVKNRLKQILDVSTAKKIYARQCKIKEVLPKVKNEFLENYHIQGKDNSNIKLGAFYNNELVAIMTFIKNNITGDSKTKECVWELNRYCDNYNYHTLGIASKLLKYFQKNYGWKSIFSCVDRRWLIDNFYYKLGFCLDNTIKPDYWYIKDQQRIKKSDISKDITKRLSRIEGRYNKVWDCGHLKFVLNN